MKLSRSHLLYVQSKYIADLFAILIAFGLSYFVFNADLINVSRKDFSLSVIIISSGWFIAGVFSKLYVDRRTKKFSEEIIVSFYNIAITILVSSSCFFYLFSTKSISNTYWALFFSTIFLFSVLFKYIIRKYTHYLIYKGELTEHFILIGYTRAGTDFIDMVERFKYYGYSCSGIIDDQQITLRNIPYLGKINQLNEILKTKSTPEIILALSNVESGLVKKIIETCEQYNRKVRLIPDLEKYTNANIEVADLGIMPVLNYKKLPLDRLENRLIKRFFDLFFSTLFFLLIGFWLLPLLAILIKYSSKGPVIFRQVRWGLSNEQIVCYKFRSMAMESTDIDGTGNYAQATIHDPRVTRLGKFLRKTSLDELPQFWNVLIGNMSVIGPRPHPVPLNMASIETVENYMLRHIVKPGISGWAQVNGFRGETKSIADMQKRVDHDLYYIHRWNIFFDIQIVLQTIINIFRGDQNAY
jgi:putative colanic acid biosynthesis UDP-glucose lipid carrier transferase